jgi:DNA repair protein RadC
VAEKDGHAGHRTRLRERFLADPETFSDRQLLELLLTYAVSRQDVAPVADRLLETFGSLKNVFLAPHKNLTQVKGVGEITAVLIQTVGQIQQRTKLESEPEVLTEEEETPSMGIDQLEIFSEANSSQARPRDEKMVERSASPKPPPPPTKADIRTYTNDLIKVALTCLPAVVNFDNVFAFSTYLEKNLPYNSANSRKRYSNNLINRYYPKGSIATALTKLLSYKPDEATWKAVLFYETSRAEPAVQFVAEQVVWPALPTGHIQREALKESLGKRFAEASEATMQRMIYSLVNLYTMLNVANQQNGVLRFQTRQGTLAAFLYVLTSEFPEPGIYAFETLEQGPARRWLLWDREWMRRQLYNLRDFGVIAKISEIDAMRQFTLSLDQITSLEKYFEHPQRDELILRDSPAARRELADTTVKGES